MYLKDNLEVVLEDRATARKVELAPFSLESLIAWLETKDPAEEYDSRNSDACLIAQYAPGRNYSVKLGALIKSGNYCPIAMVAYGPAPLKDIQTFGAALERARAYQAGMS